MARLVSYDPYAPERDDHGHGTRTQAGTRSSQTSAKPKKRRIQAPASTADKDVRQTVPKKRKLGNASAKLKAPRTPASRTTRPPSSARRRTPAALRLGTYLIDGTPPEPESDSDDELLIVGREWAARVIRSTKKRRISKTRSVPGSSGRRASTLDSARKVLFSGARELDEEPQDTFAYTHLTHERSAPLPLSNSPRGDRLQHADAEVEQAEDIDSSFAPMADRDDSAETQLEDEVMQLDDHHDNHGDDGFVWTNMPATVPDHKGSPLRGEQAIEVERVIESLHGSRATSAEEPFERTAMASPTVSRRIGSVLNASLDLEVDEEADTLIDDLSERPMHSPVLTGSVLKAELLAESEDNVNSNESDHDEPSSSENSIEDPPPVSQAVPDELAPSVVLVSEASSVLIEARSDLQSGTTHIRDDGDEQEAVQVAPALSLEGPDAVMEVQQTSEELETTEEEVLEDDDQEIRSDRRTPSRSPAHLHEVASAKARQIDQFEHSHDTTSMEVHFKSPLASTPASRSKSPKVPSRTLGSPAAASPRSAASIHSHASTSPALGPDQAKEMALSIAMEVNSPSSSPKLSRALSVLDDEQMMSEDEVIQPDEEDDMGMDTDSTEEVAISLTMDRLESPKARMLVTSTPSRFGKKLLHESALAATPSIALPTETIISQHSSPSTLDRAIEVASQVLSSGLREDPVETDSADEMQLHNEETPVMAQASIPTVGDAFLDQNPQPSISMFLSRDCVSPRSRNPADEATATALRTLSISPAQKLNQQDNNSARTPVLGSPRVPEAVSKVVDTSPLPRQRITSLASSPGKTPRPSLVALMQDGSDSSSEEENGISAELLSGLISPTALALSSPGQAKRLSALGSLVALPPSVPSASQATRLRTPPSENSRSAPGRSAPSTPSTPLQSPLTIAKSHLTGQFRRTLALGVEQSGGEEDSLRDTPEAERSVAHSQRMPAPLTPSATVAEESDDSLRDTPVHERTQYSFALPNVSPSRPNPARVQIERSVAAFDGIRRDVQEHEHDLPRGKADSPMEIDVVSMAGQDVLPLSLSSPLRSDRIRTPTKSPTPISVRASSTPAERRSKHSQISTTPSAPRAPIMSTPGRGGRVLEVHDLLIDDSTLYSGDVFDPMPLDQPHAGTSGAEAGDLYTYANRRSVTPIIDNDHSVQGKAEGPQGTIYPPDTSQATPDRHQYSDIAVTVRDPDSEDPESSRRPSLRNRPPTPGQSFRGSVFVATPGASPANAPRLSPAVKLSNNHQPNLRVILQPKKTGIPRRMVPSMAQEDVSGASAATAQGSRDSSQALQRAISAEPLRRSRRKSNMSASDVRPRHDKDSFVEIRSSDPKLAARVAALLKVEHRFINEDNSQEDSLQAEESQRLLHEAEVDIVSQVDEDSVAGRRRSASPFFPRHYRSMSATSAHRVRHFSANSAQATPAHLQRGPAMAPLSTRVGDQWTKDDWRRLEQALRDEQMRSQVNGMEEPSDEEVARIFLFSEGVQRDRCEKHWSWEKLTIRVHALRQTRCRARSASLSHSSLSQRGAGTGLASGSRASSVALEQYRKESARPPADLHFSTPNRSASAPPNPPPTAPGGLFQFMQNRLARPTSSTASVFGDATPASLPARRGLLSMLGLTKSPGSHQPETISPALRRPPVPLFRETSPPRKKAALSRTGSGNVERWASGVENEMSGIMAPNPPKGMQQIQAIEERERSYEEAEQRPSRLPIRTVMRTR